jgi:predicted nucleic acid-binding protein
VRLLTLDASVVLKWYSAADESHLDRALALQDDYQAGTYRVVAPFLLALEMMNVASRRWRWTADQIDDMAMSIRDLRFELHVPDLTLVARWVGRGLTAYDAAYVAVAVEHGTTLVTDDRRMVSIADGIAVALADVA